MTLGIDGIDRALKPPARRFSRMVRPTLPSFSLAPITAIAREKTFLRAERGRLKSSSLREHGVVLPYAYLTSMGHRLPRDSRRLLRFSASAQPFLEGDNRRGCRATARMRSHASASSGPVWNATFMNGTYVKAICAAIIAATPASSQRLEKKPSDQAEWIKRSAVDEVKDFDKDDDVDHHRARFRQRSPARRAPKGKGQTRRQESGGRPDAVRMSERKRKHGLARITRRTLHQAALLDFEGKRHSKKDRRGHVDPEQLHRQRGQA